MIFWLFVGLDKDYCDGLNDRYSLFKAQSEFYRARTTILEYCVRRHEALQEIKNTFICACNEIECNQNLTLVQNAKIYSLNESQWLSVLREISPKMELHSTYAVYKMLEIMEQEQNATWKVFPQKQTLKSIISLEKTKQSPAKESLLRIYRALLTKFNECVKGYLYFKSMEFVEDCVKNKEVNYSLQAKMEEFKVKNQVCEFQKSWDLLYTVYDEESKFLESTKYLVNELEGNLNKCND